MPHILTTANGQTKLEYKECLFFKVNEGRYKLTDHAVIIYRPNGYDFFRAKEEATTYSEFRKWLFRVGEPIGEKVWQDYAASIIETAHHLSL